MLRIATLEDYDLVFKHMEAFVKSIPMFNNHADWDKIKATIKGFLIADPNTHVVILNGEDGMLAATITEYLIGNIKVAGEIAWWVEPNARSKHVGSELLEAFEFWAKKLNCKLMTMACLDEKVGKFLDSKGYSLQERGYFKEV